MVQDMKVNGKKISNMVRVLKHGQMVPAMKVTMLKERKMESENSNGPMEAPIMDNSLKITSMEMVKLNHFH